MYYCYILLFDIFDKQYFMKILLIIMACYDDLGLFFIIDWFTAPPMLLFGKLKKQKLKIYVFYSLLT